MSDIIMVEVDRLIEYPGNPRHGDVASIARSLERFGQVKPIIVQRSSGYVVAGNHVLKAAKRLGWSTVKVLVEDMDDDTAKGYLIADNLTSEKGTSDRGALGDMTLSVLDLTGVMTEDELEAMRSDGSSPSSTDDGEEPDAMIAAAEVGYDPLREIMLMVPLSEMDAFTHQISSLQEHWQERTTVAVIRRVINIAFDALPKPEEGFIEQAPVTF